MNESSAARASSTDGEAATTCEVLFDEIYHSGMQLNPYYIKNNRQKKREKKKKKKVTKKISLSLCHTSISMPTKEEWSFAKIVEAFLEFLIRNALL